MGFHTGKHGKVYNDDKKSHGSSGHSPGNNDGSSSTSRDDVSGGHLDNHGISESFYKEFWDHGANGLFEWYNDMALDDAHVSKKEFDEDVYYAGLHPDWDEFSEVSKKKLRREIRNWAGGKLLENPQLITVKTGWGNDESTYYYVDPNDYADVADLQSNVVDDILGTIDEPDGYVKSTTFKEGKVTIDDLRQFKKREDDEYDESQISFQVNRIHGEMESAKASIRESRFNDLSQDNKVNIMATTFGINPQHVDTSDFEYTDFDDDDKKIVDSLLDDL